MSLLTIEFLSLIRCSVAFTSHYEVHCYMISKESVAIELQYLLFLTFKSPLSRLKKFVALRRLNPVCIQKHLRVYNRLINQSIADQTCPRHTIHLTVVPGTMGTTSIRGI